MERTIPGNESGHVHVEEEICHEKSSKDVGLGQVNEACTDEIINLEHDDTDADTQPQMQIQPQLKMQIHSHKIRMLTFQKLLSTLKTWEIMRIIKLEAAILISLQ